MINGQELQEISGNLNREGDAVELQSTTKFSKFGGL